MKHQACSSREVGSTPMADNLLPDYIKKAYEKELKFAIKAWELMPPIPQRPLTRKDKINIQIRRKKMRLGRALYRVANKLGYYDDCY